MNIISMYLPQYHKVKENDEWWGEGYTEWVAVKNANKLYDKHMQPNIPLNEYYYDLMEKETMQWQVDLMHKYGITGQCFYHYWFKDGRRILEKPAENLLQWSDIDMPFCFCWANETWARTWSNIKEKNVWTVRFDETERRSGSGILLDQYYGEKNDWKIHYDYLRKFFKDNRYIKYNGKPIFVIYKTKLIPCLGEMLANWHKWAKEDGFRGIYVIGANTNIDTEQYLDGVLNHEPQNAISKLFIKEKIEHEVIKYQYTEIWDTILSAGGYGEKTYYGGFVRYDDTPRRGKGGIVVEGATPELFREYLSMLIAKNMVAGNEYIFLNAWNEWGEGMYLEPDVRSKYSYLEAIKYACEHYIKYLQKYRREEECFMVLRNEMNIYRSKTFKYERYWKVFDAWMELREQGKNVGDYLKLYNIRKVAIYGAGMMGKHLITELCGNGVEVVCAIDRKAGVIESDVKLYTLENKLPDIEAVIITVLTEAEEIMNELKTKFNCRIFLLEKLIMNLLENRYDL